MKKLSDLVHEATNVDSKGFLDLVSQVDQLLFAEDGRVGEMQITGRLVRLPPSGEAAVVGDIHGDIDSLKHVLTETNFLERATESEEVYLVFLGDYGDRGPNSAEVYYVVLSLKGMFQERVVLLQGNHEGPEDLLASPHDLPYHLQRKFGADWHAVYRDLSRLFRRFYTAVIVDGKCVMLHGGIPSKAKNLDDVAYAYEKHPKEIHLEEILWSDPSDGVTGAYTSPRGAGNIFGEDVTTAFLRMVGARYLIRGHEPVFEGYRINHSGKILTLFTRKGPPYFNRHGAYVTLGLSKVYDSAWQLQPFIRQF